MSAQCSSMFYEDMCVCCIDEVGRSMPHFKWSQEGALVHRNRLWQWPHSSLQNYSQFIGICKVCDWLKYRSENKILARLVAIYHQQRNLLQPGCAIYMSQKFTMRLVHTSSNLDGSYRAHARGRNGRFIFHHFADINFALFLAFANIPIFMKLCRYVPKIGIVWNQKAISIYTE